MFPLSTAEGHGQSSGPRMLWVLSPHSADSCSHWFSHDTGRLCPHSSWNTIPPLWKECLFPILTRKSWATSSCSPFSICENHIIKLLWKGEDQTILRVEETVITEEAMGTVSAEMHLQGGHSSPILDYKLVHYVCRFCGRLSFYGKNKIQRSQSYFYCVGWRKDMGKVSWFPEEIQSFIPTLHFTS